MEKFYLSQLYVIMEKNTIFDKQEGELNMKIRLIDMLTIAKNYGSMSGLVVVRDDSTETPLFKGLAKDTPFKVLKLEVTGWYTYNEYIIFEVDTGEEKVYTYSVDFVDEDMGISVDARSEAEAKEIAENPMNWKDGKKRTVKTVERW